MSLRAPNHLPKIPSSSEQAVGARELVRGWRKSDNLVSGQDLRPHGELQPSDLYTTYAKETGFTRMMPSLMLLPNKVFQFG